MSCACRSRVCSCEMIREMEKTYLGVDGLRRRIAEGRLERTSSSVARKCIAGIFCVMLVNFIDTICNGTFFSGTFRKKNEVGLPPIAPFVGSRRGVFGGTLSEYFVAGSISQRTHFCVGIVHTNECAAIMSPSYMSKPDHRMLKLLHYECEYCLFKS